MSEKQTDREEKLGNSELLEDIFGLNIRGLRTIWDMFVRPAQVFAAARSADWRGTYTPSIRLVFSLAAVAALLQFLWGNENSITFKNILEELVAAEAFPDAASAEAATKRIVDMFAALYPLVFLLMHFIAASLVRVWGPGTGFVIRLRLWFLTITPGATLGTLLLLTLAVAPSWDGFMLSLGGMLISLGGDSTTAFRGGVWQRSNWGRLWRAALFAFVSLVATILVSITCFTIAGSIVMFGTA